MGKFGLTEILVILVIVLLLFGGKSLGDALQAQEVEYDEKLMPLSEQRFLFVSKPRQAKYA